MGGRNLTKRQRHEIKMINARQFWQAVEEKNGVEKAFPKKLTDLKGNPVKIKRVQRDFKNGNFKSNQSDN